MRRRREDDAKRRAERLANETPKERAWQESWEQTVNEIHARNGFPSIEKMRRGAVPEDTDV